MTDAQFNRAVEIKSEIKIIKEDLAIWEMGKQPPVSPSITLRYGALRYIPVKEFDVFITGCISFLEKRIAELEAEFSQL